VSHELLASATTHETRFRRTTFTPPQNAAPAAYCDLFLLRRLHVATMLREYVPFEDVDELLNVLMERKRHAERRPVSSRANSQAASHLQDFNDFLIKKMYLSKVAAACITKYVKNGVLRESLISDGKEAAL